MEGSLQKGPDCVSYNSSPFDSTTIRKADSILPDQSFTFGVLSAVLSLIISLLLLFTGIAARRGLPWAAGKSARRARRHRRTRSGHVVAVPDGTEIPPDEAVTVGELEAARRAAEAQADAEAGVGVGGGPAVDERTGLLASQGGNSGAGGSAIRATD